MRCNNTKPDRNRNVADDDNSIVKIGSLEIYEGEEPPTGKTATTSMAIIA
jgi:hypothetical protein